MQRPLRSILRFVGSNVRGCHCATAAAAARAFSDEAGAAAEVQEGAQKGLVVRPSITWGVLADKTAQKAGRNKVLDLLRSRGINTGEFGSVELPTSTDVMLERLEFLKGMGLEVEHINEYPLVVCCSVKKNMMPVIDYLEALGFTTTQMTALLQKYPMVLHTSVSVDVQPVIMHLLGLGVLRHRIPQVLLKYPDVLGFRLEGTMSTSVAYLVSLGVQPREIAPILEMFPQILGMRVGSNIKVKVDYIRSLGIAREAAGRIIERNPQILGNDIEQLQERVGALTKAGVTPEWLPVVITQYPRLLMMADLEEKLRNAEEWLKEVVKVSSQEFPRIVERLPQIVDVTDKYAGARVRFFRRSGFNEKNVAKMAVSCPLILVLDVQGWMKPSLNFFRREMKRDRKELVDFPAFFTYGLEERIRFRHRRVVERGLKFSLRWLLNCSDAKFQERLSSGVSEPEEPGAISEMEFVMGGPVESLVKQSDTLDTSAGQSEDEEEEDDQENWGMPQV